MLLLDCVALFLSCYPTLEFQSCSSLLSGFRSTTCTTVLTFEMRRSSIHFKIKMMKYLWYLWGLTLTVLTLVYPDLNYST
jgi:hypothetical protein